MLVCCDGATSRLATSLGYCTEPPKGVCSRSYVEGGTHNTNFDGAVDLPGALHRSLCPPSTPPKPRLASRHTEAASPLITDSRSCSGVCFYAKESLPGYCAIFREAGDDLNMCYYLIPQGEGDGQCGAVKVPCHSIRAHPLPPREARQAPLEHLPQTLDVCCHACATLHGKSLNKQQYEHEYTIAWCGCMYCSSCCC